MKKEHIPINKWIEEERPREMLFKKGAENLSLASLLAIIIRTGTKGKSAQDIALELLNKFGSLRKIDKLSFQELANIKGIGFSKAAQIKAALEIGKRLLKEQSKKIKNIKSFNDAVEYIFETQGIYLRDKDNEYFYTLFLNFKNAPIDMVMISKGSSNATVVDTKEIIRNASLKNASGVILIHNHPSGDTTPSKNDIDLTKKIKSALELVNVKLIDHIIIGKDKHESFSFAENGII